MTIIHVMIDAETWGKRAGFDIRSIGACVFDPIRNIVFNDSVNTPFYVATDNPEQYHGARSEIKGFKYPLQRDPETVAWWAEQDINARINAFANPIDLRDALVSFGQWLKSLTDYPTAYPWFYTTQPHSLPDTIRLWSHGPAFDTPILEAAYHAVGLPVPWHYRAPRDTRTCFDMAGIDDHSRFMQQYNYGTPHHARDDAISQAMAVCGAYERVRVPAKLHEFINHSGPSLRPYVDHNGFDRYDDLREDLRRFLCNA